MNSQIFIICVFYKQSRPTSGTHLVFYSIVTEGKAAVQDTQIQGLRLTELEIAWRIR